MATESCAHSVAILFAFISHININIKYHFIIKSLDYMQFCVASHNYFIGIFVNNTELQNITVLIQ